MSRRYKIKEETIDRGVDGKRLYFIPEYKDSFFEKWKTWQTGVIGDTVKFPTKIAAKDFIEQKINETLQNKEIEEKYTLITELFSILFPLVPIEKYKSSTGLFKEEEIERLKFEMEGDFFPKYIKINNIIGTSYIKYNSYNVTGTVKDMFKITFSTWWINEHGITLHSETGLFLPDIKRPKTKQTIEQCTKDEFDDAVIRFVMNI